jgi:hypothetical protein
VEHNAKLLDKQYLFGILVSTMIEKFKYVEVDEKDMRFVGRKEEGKRKYTVIGSVDNYSAWFDAVTRIAGPCVSPGGGCMFVPVSRAGIHHRIEKNELTCFVYEIKESVSLLGFKWDVRKEPFIYVPVSELKEWRKDIEYRLLREGAITQEKLEALQSGKSVEAAREKKKGRA